MNQELTQESVTYGRLLRKKGFVSYLIAEFLSALSDNTYKFFLMFMIKGMFDHETTAVYIAVIGAIFSAPYLLFLGYAGYLSDRFSKRNIFMYVKLSEIIITSFILLAMFIGNVDFMLVCLFLMMTRSCIFFPAKVGLLPEMLEKQYLSVANSLLWMSVFIAAIIGAVLGGLFVEWFASQLWMVGLILIGVAVLGYLNSLRIPKTEVVVFKKPFPINPWRDIWESAKTIRRRKSIAVAILGIGWFWFLGALVQMILPLYGETILHVNDFYSSLLQGVIGLGIAAGCIVAGWYSKDTYEPGLIPFGSIGIAIGTLWAAFSGDSYIQTVIGLGITGFSAGLFIIPIYTFLHQRAKGNERGRIFATANYVDTLGMLIASFAYFIFGATVLKLPEDKILALFGIVTVAITIYALKELPIFFFRVINFLITRVSYRINVKGLENIPDKGGVILVPNHVTYIDGLLIWSACRKRNISFMIYHKMYNLKLFSWLFKILQYIPVYEGRRVKESLDVAKHHLQTGGTICIFPEGELTRTGSMLPFRRGVERLIEGVSSKNVPIIPVYIDQVWGSIFSYERGKFFFKIPHEVPAKISITFGKPLPSGTTSQEIRKAVTELGYASVQLRKSKQDILPLEILKIAKKRWFSPMLTMPQIKPISYGKLIITAIKFIEVLVHRLNAKSKIIAVIGHPSFFTVVTNLTLMFMNKTVVNLSSNLSDKELRDACKSLNVDEILVFDESKPLAGCIKHVINGQDLRVNVFKSAIIGTGILLCPLRFLVKKLLGNKAGPDDVALILSDDIHKPTHITHYNILSNTEAFSQLLFMRHKDWILSEASYQSSVGAIGQLWYPLLNAVGIACTNVEPDRVTVSTINALMKQYKITLLISNSEFYRKILNSGQALTFPDVRFAVAVGTTKDDSIYTQFEEKIHVELFEGFGLPEIPLVVSLNHNNYISGSIKQMGTKKGSFGKPLPGIQTQIVDPKTKVVLPAGEEGVLMIKGPNIPANIATEDGWINTTQQAIIDDEGFLHLISEGNA
ncbi:MFS transporter [Candidatus Bodocaedibacter vickermanii]|uniref:Acyl-[ACP]--phospholipid O-acyltransferase n=1 Tax=Candidatus Bodocaedibacter vickermanii TaxID=2741701 RepID=A0A7L9RSP9_9PROT|nr:acyl-[ACP]--phospholipid O-acyltransferase [Candidatus Paracaedibacteraceae bacterium 'Lake Konstanz']